MKQHGWYSGRECLRRQSQRAEGATDSADPIAQAFWPVLPLMLSAVASKGGHTPEVLPSHVISWLHLVLCPGGRTGDSGLHWTLQRMHARGEGMTGCYSQCDR